MRKRGMLRIHERSEKMQEVAERRVDGELTQPGRAPRKNERAIGQTNAGYRPLSQGLDFTGFEDALCHGGPSLRMLNYPRRKHGKRPALLCAEAIKRTSIPGLDALFARVLAQYRRYFCAIPLVTSRNHAR